MTEIEKVKKGLDLCLSGVVSVCIACPYDAECKEACGIGPSPLRRDALALLKEQEAKTERKLVLERDGYYLCPNCEKTLGKRRNYRIIYCSRCGQAVRWND